MPPAMTGAERQAAYRSRRGRTVSVLLPDDLKQQLDNYIGQLRQDGRGNVTLSDVINELLRAELAQKANTETP